MDLRDKLLQPLEEDQVLILANRENTWSDKRQIDYADYTNDRNDLEEEEAAEANAIKPVVCSLADDSYHSIFFS